MIAKHGYFLGISSRTNTQQENSGLPNMDISSRTNAHTNNSIMATKDAPIGEHTLANPSNKGGKSDWDNYDNNNDGNGDVDGVFYAILWSDTPKDDYLKQLMMIEDRSKSKSMNKNKNKQDEKEHVSNNRANCDDDDDDDNDDDSESPQNLG
eukprot:jgi/Psemu1/13259/gm1.13259_g